MQMDISFPGEKRVNSTYKGFTVATDQPKNEGGDGTAPEPYDLVLAALGTCAGVYVLYFCEERNIDFRDVKITLHAEKNESTHLFEKIHIQITLPAGFPKKYKSAIARAAELCTVKRGFASPPHFTVEAAISK